MKKLHLSIIINASIEKVWDTIIGKETYKLWTESFYPGSDIIGSWKKGERVYFVGPNEKGKNDGMVSEIAEVRKPEFISIKHIGFLQNGVEDTSSPAITAWAPSYENYTLKKIDESKTEFILDLDAMDNFYDYFLEAWPKAMKKLKEVAETGTSSTISIINWVNAPIEKVWECYNSPEHITKWAFASDDWEAPKAENDVKVGGQLKITMAAKDKSAQFDLIGTYTQVRTNEFLEYKMTDGRIVSVSFSPTPTAIQIITTFDMEHENSREKQAEGWQAILNNFKKHVEGH